MANNENSYVPGIHLKQPENQEEVADSQDPHIFLNLPIKDCKRTLSPKEVVLTLLRIRAWKQTDLAREIGISKQALNNYICGRWGVPTQIKLKIASALQVDAFVIWDFPKREVA